MKAFKRISPVVPVRRTDTVLRKVECRALLRWSRHSQGPQSSGFLETLASDQTHGIGNGSAAGAGGAGLLFDLIAFAGSEEEVFFQAVLAGIGDLVTAPLGRQDRVAPPL